MFWWSVLGVILGIPAYLFVGKVIGRKIAAVLFGVFLLLLYWDLSRYRSGYLEVIEDIEEHFILRLIWPLAVIIYAAAIFCAAVFRAARLIKRLYFRIISWCF